MSLRDYNNKGGYYNVRGTRYNNIIHNQKKKAGRAVCEGVGLCMNNKDRAAIL